MLRKEAPLDDLEKEKRRYYDHIGRLQRECLKWFTLRNIEKCFEAISQIEEYTQYSFDVAILKEIYALQG